MLEEGIIQLSKSAWSSPVVLVKNSDGTTRFCVDYRKLNKVTMPDAYPLPYVSTILDHLRNAKFLSSLDIRSAYWQVQVYQNSKEKTTFTVPNRGIFQFRRMPFGLCSAPWQRLIHGIVRAYLEPQVFVYLDDIIVLQRLRDAGLTLNWEKCKFCRSELFYLGYIVDKDGLRVDPEKVAAIRDYSTPRNSKEIRQFIGWYRRYVPNFSGVIEPLTSLLRKSNAWQWAYVRRTLKEALISAPILTFPDYTFIVQTDASSTGLGAILC